MFQESCARVLVYGVAWQCAIEHFKVTNMCLFGLGSSILGSSKISVFKYRVVHNYIKTLHLPFLDEITPEECAVILNMRICIASDLIYEN